MTRVLTPAGQCVILEFSRPQSSVVQALYSMHADTIIPKMGAILSNNPAAYQYLVDSIETHPEPSVVTHMMHSAGLTNLQISPILSGLVCIHRGWKCWRHLTRFMSSPQLSPALPSDQSCTIPELYGKDYWHIESIKLDFIMVIMLTHCTLPGQNLIIFTLVSPPIYLLCYPSHHCHNPTNIHTSSGQ